MTPLEKIAITSSCTLALGGWAGYKLRRLVERVKLRREAKRMHTAQVGWEQKLVADVKARDQQRALKPNVMPAHMEPVRVPRSFEQPLQVVEDDTNRDDVVAALVGAGFKKREAERAVDACALYESECTSVEVWTASALRRAARRA